MLIVDDVSTIRLLLSLLLERMGHQVRSVESGAQALHCLNDYPADVIISDISMPEMNGYELVQQLRRRPDTRLRFVVAMTANGAIASEETSLAVGFDAHLAKPFNVASLERLMHDPRILLGHREFG